MAAPVAGLPASRRTSSSPSCSAAAASCLPSRAAGGGIRCIHPSRCRTSAAMIACVLHAACVVLHSYRLGSCFNHTWRAWLRRRNLTPLVNTLAGDRVSDPQVQRGGARERSKRRVGGSNEATTCAILRKTQYSIAHPRADGSMSLFLCLRAGGIVCAPRYPYFHALYISPSLVSHTFTLYGYRYRYAQLLPAVQQRGGDGVPRRLRIKPAGARGVEGLERVHRVQYRQRHHAEQ